MSRFFPSLAAIACSVLSFAATAQDSLVYFRDLKFNSPFEQEVFHKIAVANESDAFDLLMANGALLTDTQVAKAKENFYAHLNALNTPKFAGRKPEARARAVAQSVRDKYLKKYQALSTFEDIFHSGSFSEVSGTALYCLAFEHLGIPYEIKEDVNNVYVVACPGPKQLMIESTFNAIQFTTFDGNFKKQFVETLRGQKVISEAEFARSTVADLFEKYYFQTNSLFNVNALAARQYYQLGFAQIESQSFAEAFQNLEKAYYLSATPKTIYTMMHAGAAAFDRMTERDIRHAILLGKISRYTGVGVTWEMIAGEYGMAVQDLLFDKGDTERLEDYFNTFNATCGNMNIKKEVAFVHHTEYGRYKYNDARYKDALVHYEEAFKLKPTNQEASTKLINCLGMVSTSSMEEEEFVKTMEGYTTRLPELSNNNLFNAMLASVYLLHSAINYEKAQPDKGDYYRKNFEELYGTRQDMKLSSNLVGRAYSAGAIHYFRKGQTKKARDFINAGLKIAPTNQELLVRQQMIR